VRLRRCRSRRRIVTLRIQSRSVKIRRGSRIDVTEQYYLSTCYRHVDWRRIKFQWQISRTVYLTLIILH